MSLTSFSNIKTFGLLKITIFVILIVNSSSFLSLTFSKETHKFYNLIPKDSETAYNNSIFDFANIEVDCPIDSVLTYFNYSIKKDEYIKIYYNCMRITDNILLRISKSTNWNDINSRNQAIYLDRHNVECDDGTVLTSFKLNTNNSNKQIRYDYECAYIKFKDLLDCDTNDISGSAKQLKNHESYNLNDSYAGNNSISRRFLKKFQLISDWNTGSGNKIYFKYKTCRYPPIHYYTGE